MACASPPAATILYNFSFSCKVDAAITSIFLVVNRFYMQILLQMTLNVLLCRFSLKFPYWSFFMQKQLSRCVFKKKFSENKHQIYWRIYWRFTAASLYGLHKYLTPK